MLVVESNDIFVMRPYGPLRVALGCFFASGLGGAYVAYLALLGQTSTDRHDWGH